MDGSVKKLPGFSRPKVAAYPFHPISPLILNKSSGGTKGPLAAAATVISPSFKSNFILAFRSDAPVTKEEETSALEEAQSSVSFSSRQPTFLGSLNSVFFCSSRLDKHDADFQPSLSNLVVILNNNCHSCTMMLGVCQ
ncbi:unnamed protein product [Fraxinus pennsylvanica]|uniref:Uncharacterized protein n=1 Tax=Fraxinus pennsylvanica TaxID=56036 RepID=A0AAD1Z5G3_9LAMI|nr:unnamed protein product [Fraxinus pennsylvanica]